MSYKRTFKKVKNAIKATQDNNTLGKDEYSKFLIKLIKNNTDQQEGNNDLKIVDTQALASDLRYAIDQFSKALVAVEEFNE